MYHKLSSSTIFLLLLMSIHIWAQRQQLWGNLGRQGQRVVLVLKLTRDGRFSSLSEAKQTKDREDSSDAHAILVFFFLSYNFYKTFLN